MSAKAKTIPAPMTRPANLSTNLSTNLAVLHMAGTPFTVRSYLWPDMDVQRGPHALRGAPQPGSISWTNPASNHARSQSCTGCRLQCQGWLRLSDLSPICPDSPRGDLTIDPTSNRLTKVWDGAVKPT